MQRRLETIDNVKVLMMLAVVLYHSCMFFTGSWFGGAKPVYEARYLSIFAQWLNTFHVQTFTMASGFLFYCLRIEKGKYIHFGKGPQYTPHWGLTLERKNKLFLKNL